MCERARNHVVKRNTGYKWTRTKQSKKKKKLPVIQLLLRDYIGDRQMRHFYQVDSCR